MTASSKRPPITHDQKAADRSVRRIKQLLTIGEMSQAEMVEILNDEGYLTLRLKPWTAVNLRQVIWKIRHQDRSWYLLSQRRAGLVIEPLDAMETMQ